MQLWLAVWMGSIVLGFAGFFTDMLGLEIGATGRKWLWGIAFLGAILSPIVAFGKLRTRKDKELAAKDAESARIQSQLDPFREKINGLLGVRRDVEQFFAVRNCGKSDESRLECGLFLFEYLKLAVERYGLYDHGAYAGEQAAYRRGLDASPDRQLKHVYSVMRLRRAVEDPGTWSVAVPRFREYFIEDIDVRVEALKSMVGH